MSVAKSSKADRPGQGGGVEMEGCWIHSAEVQALVDSASQKSADQITQPIRECAEQAASHAQNATRSGASALVYAGACGKLLNTVKSQLRHGEFGKWREDEILSGSLSERTSNRYMALAAKFEDIEELMDSASSLRRKRSTLPLYAAGAGSR